MKVSLYIHIPFCEVKCGYCDFFSVPRGYENFDLQREYTDQLINEIEIRSPRLDRPPIGSIFFGGGTPSLLDPELLEKIMATLAERFRWTGQTEITLEANPKTVSREKLAQFRALGINRLSIGVQSFQDRFLKVLGRIHSSEEARETIENAFAAGFENVNLDLIYGLPSQTIEEFRQDLETALSLGTGHFSAYNLTVEEGTPFERRYRRGELQLPGEGIQREMLDLLSERAASRGFIPYEISNFARPGFECRHNLNYWDYGEYLGFGAGAVSFISGDGYANFSPEPPRKACSDGVNPILTGNIFNRNLPLSLSPRRERVDAEGGRVRVFGYRRQNVRDLKRYLAGEWEKGTEEISQQTAMGEFFMMGLRKQAGIFRHDFRRLFHAGAEEIFPILRHLVSDGWFEEGGGRIRLTQKGFPVANELIQKFF